MTFREMDSTAMRPHGPVVARAPRPTHSDGAHGGRSAPQAEIARREPGTQAVRRVFRQQVKSALDALEHAPASDAAVHAARKDLKRARATLRLLREAVGQPVYARENAVLRDVARSWSVLRDARVLLDQLDGLVERCGAPARALPLENLRRELRRERRAARRQWMQHPDALLSEVAALQNVYERSARWRVGERGWSVLGPGLKHVYARGRRGLTLAAAKRSPENLHEWRKQAKYLWHQLQLLTPLWPGQIGELADQAHKLADYLGNDHDLAVLRARVLDRAQLLPTRTGRGVLLGMIDQVRTELQDKAFVLGERIYGRRPQAFAARLGRYWSEWHRPAS
jgi:CHAD domain-containing protein